MSFRLRVITHSIRHVFRSSTQQEVDREDEDYVEDVDYEEEGAELEEGTFSFEAKKADELEVTHRESPPTYEESAGEIEEQEIEEELSMETEREEEPEVLLSLCLIHIRLRLYRMRLSRIMRRRKVMSEIQFNRHRRLRQSKSMRNMVRDGQARAYAQLEH